MNRRNFFKTVTGFVAGVYAACVPKVKAEPRLTVAMLIKCRDELDAKKVSGTMFVPKAKAKVPMCATEVAEIKDELWIQVQQIDCRQCDRKDIVKESLYVRGTPIECECGMKTTLRVNLIIAKEIVNPFE